MNVFVHNFIRYLIHIAGFGGGYMEREEVEYVAREGSDSEYDEVGSVCMSHMLYMFMMWLLFNHQRCNKITDI